MDMSDMGVRHAVAVSTFNVKHSVDLSPSTVAVAREIRLSIIAIVVGIGVLSIVKSLLSSKSAKDSAD